eukprot:TRINITY_DN6655_c0_g1_i1.p2 TRINITY_DN6655_c0_g1~~TRINITY_DN6655_c0_g1_i1.p2  ORF type:complete len:127 (-),score=23.40 TRINITY_DN6655_c0_g1_i1:31-411(-)
MKSGVYAELYLKMERILKQDLNTFGSPSPKPCTCFLCTQIFTLMDLTTLKLKKVVLGLILIAAFLLSLQVTFPTWSIKDKLIRRENPNFNTTNFESENQVLIEEGINNTTNFKVDEKERIEEVTRG